MDKQSVLLLENDILKICKGINDTFEFPFYEFYVNK